MSLLIELPKYMFWSFCTEWLHFDEICFMDSSFCHRSSRQKYLELISDRKAMFKGIDNIPIGLSYFSWLTLRNVRISTISVHSLAKREIPEDFCDCSNVGSFKIENCTEHDLSAIISITSLCVELRHLTVHSTYLQDSNFIPILTSCAHLLRAIDFANIFTSSKSVSSESIELILSLCPYLESLDVSQHNIKHDPQIFNLPAPTIGPKNTNSNEEQATTVSDTESHNHVHKAINVEERILLSVTLSRPVVSSLTHLNMNQCRTITDQFMQYMTIRCPHLSALHLQSCYLLTDASLLSVSACCPDLTSLDMTFFVKGAAITVAGIQSICSGCQKLKTIRLSCSTVLDINAAVELLTEQFSAQLAELTITQPNYIKTDTQETFTLSEASIKLITQCPELTVWNVNPPSLSDANLWLAVSSCQNLTSITISSFSITDDGLCAAVVQCGSQLRVLSLHCVEMRDVSLETIGAQCSGLTSLELLRNEKITDSGVLAIAQGCRSLKILALSSCSRISDGGITHVSAYCRSLQELSILRCSVTAASVHLIAMSTELYSLRKVSFYISPGAQSALQKELVALRNRKKNLKVFFN